MTESKIKGSKLSGSLSKKYSLNLSLDNIESTSSSSSNSSTSSPIPSRNHSHHKRLNSSNNIVIGHGNIRKSTPPSSWSHRRSSFMSESMISNETHNSYEVGKSAEGFIKFNLNVKESQGFQWNPQLFRYGNDRSFSEDYINSDFEHNRPKVTEIVISDMEDDGDEDIFPTDY